MVGVKEVVMKEEEEGVKAGVESVSKLLEGSKVWNE